MFWGAIFRLIGQFLLVLGGSMLIPFGADLLYGRPEWVDFGLSAGITAIAGLAMLGICWEHKGQQLNLRGGFLLMMLTWSIIPFFAALPLWLAPEVHSYNDA